MEGEAKGGSFESRSRKRDKLDSDGAKRGSSRTTNSGSIMYKSLRLKQALESKIGRTIEKEMGLKQMERDSINLVDQGRRRMKDHIEEFALALTRSLLLPEVDDGEEKQFVEAKIKEFVSDLLGLRMEKEDQGEEEEEEEQEEMMCVGEEQVAAAAAKAEESEEFLERRREVGVEVQTADEFLERSRKAEMKTGEEELPGAEDCLERSRKVKLQAAEKEFLERHRDCKAEVEGAVVLEEDGAIDKSVTEKEEIWFAGTARAGNEHGATAIASRI